MLIDKLINNKSRWLEPPSGIVISTRARLARNVEGYPFPWKAPLSARRYILKMAEDAISRIEYTNSLEFIKMDAISVIDKQFLVERHLISQEHTRLTKGKGLILSEQEDLSIMINEEDHLRIQTIVPGFDLNEAWMFVDRVDDELSKYLPFSFMADIGYLTACPTNVGTALRVSCMLHLPALVLTKRIDKVLKFLDESLFTARGAFGEGTQALGNFFQVSNRITLGISEEEIINQLSEIVRQIKEQELDSRALLLDKYRRMFEDSVWRSLGILRNCRLISTKEAFSHLSLLYAGIDLNIIKNIKKNTVSNLFVIIQPAHLQKTEGKILEEEDRDYIRASIISEYLK